MTHVVLLGHGRWGTNIHRTLTGMRDVTVHVFDPRLSSPTSLPKSIDAAIIATPGTTHAYLAIPFLEKGIPTFIEKPLTTSLADAQTIERLAKRQKTIVMVGHIHLHNPAYQTAKSLVPSLGPIRSLHGEGLSNGPYRDDMSVLWDWAPHDLSMMLDVVGAMPRSVQAWGLSILRPKTKLYDMVSMALVFPKSILATVHVSWLFPEKRRKLTIIGTKSSIVLDDRAERKVMIHKNMGPEVQRTTGKKIPSVISKEPSILYPAYASGLPLSVELTAFFDAVKTKRQPSTDVRQGVQVVRILDAAERSIAKGGQQVVLRS